MKLLRYADAEIPTVHGPFRLLVYRDAEAKDSPNAEEHMAIVRGEVTGASNVLCRVHSHCVGAHLFNSIECDCREQMAAAQAAIEKAGRGIVIWLDQEAKGNGHLALIQSTSFKRAGDPQAIAYQKAGFRADARDYQAAAQILSDLGVKSVILLATDDRKADDLRRDGISVSSTRSL